MRRDLFSRPLTRRYEIDFPLLSEVVGAFLRDNHQPLSVDLGLGRFVVNFKLSSVLAATFFALIAAAVLLIGGRRMFGHLFEADPDRTDPSYLSRLSVAFWSTLLPSLALGVFLGRHVLAVRLFPGAAWRHRLHAGVAVRRDRASVLRASAGTRRCCRPISRTGG